MKTPLKSLFSSRLLQILAVLSVIALATYFGGQRWIGSRIESRFVTELREHGVGMQRESSAWDPWRGLHITGLRLRELGGGQQPLAELGNLEVNIPFSQYLGRKPVITRWHISDSPLTIHDDTGSVSLEHVSLRLDASKEEIIIRSLTAVSNGLTAKLAGTVKIFRVLSSQSMRPDLAAIRATLATLDVRPGTGPFQIKGKFHVDAGTPELTWNAHLDGHGKNLEWKGVRLAKATAQAELSSAGSAIRYALFTAHGSAQGAVSAVDWKKSPVTFAGTLQDAAGRTDEYRGRSHNRLFTVESLKGRADLWALSTDIPSATTSAPDRVKFKSFPLIDARNIRHDSGAASPRWTVESVAISSPDPVGFTIGGRELEARNLSATAAYDGRDWSLKDSQMKILGGSLSVQGRYGEGVLRQAKVEIQDMRVSGLRELSGDGAGKASDGVVSARYQGSVDFTRQQCEGHGSMHLTHAPIVEVPLLDQVYELFAALVPGVQRPKEGEFDAEFKARPDLIEVTRFEAKGGASLTVSAVGTVDLKQGRVTGRARGKLVGLPGLVTSPLSRLLEMEVAGPYDNIRVKPLGPARLASHTVAGTVGVAVDTIEEAGKITGTVLTEGIKVPFKLFRKDPPEKETPGR